MSPRRVARSARRTLTVTALTATLLAATGLRPAAAQDGPSVGELRVQAGILLDRLEAIETQLAAADVTETTALTAELDALLAALGDAVRQRAAEVAKTTLRQFPLVRSSALPRFDIPGIVRVAADPEGLADPDPADRRSWTNVRDARAKAVRARRAAELADGPLEDLSAVLVAATPGTIILLEPGHHTLIDAHQFRIAAGRDIAIIGPGREACTIHVDRSGELSTAERLLIHGVTIDSNSTPLVDFRGGGRLILSEVAIAGYNSGAGGSNGLFLSGPATLILDRVLMNGRPGRSGGSGSLGDALDVRGDVLVHARQSRFLDHDELGRFGSVTVFDRCIGLNRGGRGDGIASEYAVGVMAARASNLPIRPRGPAGIDVLAASADDAAVIRIAAGMAPDDRSRVPDREDDAETSPEAARDLVDRLSLATRAPYWIALLADHRPEVRLLAAERVRAMLGPAGLPAAHLTIADAVGPDATTVDELVPGFLVHGRVRSWWEASADAVEWDADAGAFRRRTP